jgi:hypothetical protein
MKTNQNGFSSTVFTEGDKNQVELVERMIATLEIK